MLVLHGGPSRPSHQPFAGLERFSKTHRVIYFDQRGCGFSTTYFEEIPGAADLRADQCHVVVESYYGVRTRWLHHVLTLDTHARDVVSRSDC